MQHFCLDTVLRQHFQGIHTHCRIVVIDETGPVDDSLAAGGGRLFIAYRGFLFRAVCQGLAMKFRQSGLRVDPCYGLHDGARQLVVRAGRPVRQGGNSPGELAVPVGL